MPPAGYPAFLQYLQSGRVRKVHRVGTADADHQGLLDLAAGRKLDRWQPPGDPQGRAGQKGKPRRFEARTMALALVKLDRLGLAPTTGKRRRE